jgi:hypothetical protein
MSGFASRRVYGGFVDSMERRKIKNTKKQKKKWRLV